MRAWVCSVPTPRPHYKAWRLELAGISADWFVQCHTRTKPDHLWGTPSQNLALTPQPTSDPSFKMRDSLWTTAHNTGSGRNKRTLTNGRKAYLWVLNVLPYLWN